MSSNSRRSRSAADRFLQLLLVAGVLGASVVFAVYFWGRWRDRTLTLEDGYLAAGLLVAAATVAFTGVGGQKRFDQWVSERENEKERRFWREREKREHLQRIHQDRIDAERAERRTRRAAELQQQMQKEMTRDQSSDR